MNRIDKTRQGMRNEDMLRVIACIKDYLQNHSIVYYEDRDQETYRITTEYHGMLNSPEEKIESCIWFYNDGGLEVRWYYTQAASIWCRKHPEQLARLYRTCNYLNARIWPQGVDFRGYILYKPSNLYAPRFYITEDEQMDPVATLIIPYDFFRVAPIETQDFFTAAMPDLMDRLAPALLYTENFEEARDYIQKNILTA